MKKKNVVAAASFTFCATLLGGPQATAIAAEDPLQQEIDETIAHYGGTQISLNEIAWDNGTIIMSFPSPGEDTAPPSSEAAERRYAAAAGVSLSSFQTLQDEEDVQPLVGNCPTETLGNDWYCFYEDSNYRGRRLQWNADHANPISFHDYGFGDEISSWVNGGGLKIWVHNVNVSTGGYVIWTECPHSSATSVGANDQADYFTENNSDC